MKGILEFYPESIKKLAENNTILTAGLARDQIMTFSIIPGRTSLHADGYHIEVYSPSDGEHPDEPIAQLDVQTDDSFVYYNRAGSKVPELYTLILPMKLRNKVSWAIGFSRRTNGKHSRIELRNHYDLLKYYYERDGRSDGHVPEYFSHGKFSAVVPYNSDGVPLLSNSAFHVNGYPTYDEAMDMLHAVKRVDGWYFSTPEKIQYVINQVEKNKPASCC